MYIFGGTSLSNGASVMLASEGDSDNGAFKIRAANSEDGSVMFLGKTDGTLTWGGVSVLNPTGTVIAFAGNSAPHGYLICNGAAVSRTTYAKLFAVIGTTYGAGNGSTTFNLPNLTNRFIMGSGTAGTSKSAGLPNIAGNLTLRPFDYNGNVYTVIYETGGAFTLASKTGTCVPVASANSTFQTTSTISFSAKASNSIYGNSTTVQPPALTMRFYIKY